MSVYTKKTRILAVDDVVTLAEVKRALNILDDEDDEELQDLIYTAFELVETYCHRCFTTCTVDLERSDSVVSFYLPFGENVIITAVKVDSVELTVSDYSYSSISEIFKLNSTSKYSKLEITYDCGFTELPRAISRGLKYLVSTMFNSGQDFVSGMDITNLPIRSTTLLDAEKHHVI